MQAARPHSEQRSTACRSGWTSHHRLSGAACSLGIRLILPVGGFV
jgi:hypothetical protein